MTLVYACLGLCLALLAISDASCPFHQGDGKHAKTPRGHNRPFGHHAKHWRRIETVYEHPDPETFYNNYVRTSKPLLIRGGAAGWPAIKKWSNVTYINSIGGRERGHVNWKKIYSYDRHHAIRIDMTMKEFTDKFHTHDLYMDSTIMAGLHKDVYWPHSLGCMFFLKRLKQLAIMMNNGRSKSDVHIDVTDTYFMQATGRRLWLLSPPTNVTNIYSGHPHLVDHAGISILNQTHMDLEKHSGASNLAIYAGYLFPGDIIYVPEAWYHQVVTYDTPNIAIVAFMNILFCEYNSEGLNDMTHVSSCVNKVLQKKPKNLKCNAFPRENITITELLKRYNPRTYGAFQGYFGGSPTKGRYLRFSRRLSDGTILPAIGMAVNGMSKEALDAGQVLRQGIIEGFRFFTTAPGDGSEEALGKFMRVSKNFRKIFRVLSYMPIEDSGRTSIAESIQRSLKNLNISRIDFVLLTAPYCVPDYKVGACTRDAFSPAWLDAWRALEAEVRAGRVRFIGVSDFSLKELQHLVKAAEVPVTIARARFDLWFRNRALRGYCNEKRIHFMGRSVLGGRWKQEQPDFPKNRDFLKTYLLQKAAYQYKLSVHSTAYIFAIMKRVIVTPRVNNPLHVRVNIKSIDSEANDQVTNIEELDRIDPTDPDGLWAKEARDDHFSTKRRGSKGNKGVPLSLKAVLDQAKKPVEEAPQEEEGDEEEAEAASKAVESEMKTEEKKEKKPFQGNYSSEVYTDSTDYEQFPSYMMGRESD